MTFEHRTFLENQRTLVDDSFCMEMVRPDTLDPIIWAGVVWLASSLGYLDGQA